MLLKNKVALITGASSGIGHALARQLAEAGAQVVVSARRSASLDHLVETIQGTGGQALAHPCDVTDPAHAEDLVQATLNTFGRLDIACNNAGTLGTMGPVDSLTLDDWNHTLRTNLSSGFLAAKAQFPAMQASGGGAILFTSSFVGHTAGMAGMTAYAASKAGLIGLTQCLAIEGGPMGIRVNALLPGGTDTAMGRTVAKDPEAQRAVASLHALGRMASPEEIAAAALHLVSPSASFVTGTAYLADGRVSVRRSLP